MADKFTEKHFTEEWTDRLKDIMEKYGFSQNMLAVKIGISPAVLSQMLKNEYPYQGDNFVWISIRRFIEKTNQKIYETRLLKVVQKTLNRTFDDKEISVITGNSGAGKTTALEWYCLFNPQAIFIRVNEVLSKKYLMSQILKAMNQPYEGFSLYDMFEAICESVSKKNKIIIIDEAERLDTHNLELLRDIYDRGNIGLALIGLETLRVLLKKGTSLRENLVQLYSRVGYQEVVDILTPGDVKMVFYDLFRNHKVSAEKCSQLSRIYEKRGGLRVIIKIANVAPKIAERNEIAIIDDDIIDAALKEFTL